MLVVRDDVELTSSVRNALVFLLPSSILIEAITED